MVLNNWKLNSLFLFHTVKVTAITPAVKSYCKLHTRGRHRNNSAIFALSSIPLTSANLRILKYRSVRFYFLKHHLMIIKSSTLEFDLENWNAENSYDGWMIKY